MRLFSITKEDSICSAAILVALLSNFVLLTPELRAEKPLQGWRELRESELKSIPAPPREFRGVWVATVYNLDWPSKPGLPVAVQKEELREIFERSKELNLNAVVFQVRTMCDALYDSPIEPWSYYLTGKMGKAPEPFYDPLAFAVEEAHARGLELHAWINPYRALTGYYGDKIADNHISQNFPWLVHKSGSHSFLDPSSVFVRNRAITVAFDIINRYDVDAIHLDDYFYPYPRDGAYEGTLDDEENWLRFQFEKGDMAKADWRRENVNVLIRDLYRDIKRHKPHVKLGISPFGIWKKGAPANIRGLSSYSQIFSDSRKWLREGWVDYFSPQLYWKMEGPQSFASLYKWWQDENVQGRHLWPGVATSRIGEEGSGGESDGRGATELLEQISFTRTHLNKSPASGQIHWHWEAFATNRGGISRMITKKRYAERALTPESPWLAGQGAEAAEDDGELPVATGINLRRVSPPVASGKKKTPSENAEEEADDTPETGSWILTWNSSMDEVSPSHQWWAVQVKTGEGEDANWELKETVRATGKRAVRISNIEKISAISIRAVDRIGELGPAAAVERIEDPEKTDSAE
ncbi:MAG: family 10 glycosylhydrolase [Verrucomicrobiales bacterium]|nr:family 10 glycosylhydrolase [Verrucomicrobiales bacterium]